MMPKPISIQLTDANFAIAVAAANFRARNNRSAGRTNLKTTPKYTALEVETIGAKGEVAWCQLNGLDPRETEMAHQRPDAGVDFSHNAYRITLRTTAGGDRGFIEFVGGTEFRAEFGVLVWDVGCRPGMVRGRHMKIVGFCTQAEWYAHRYRQTLAAGVPAPWFLDWRRLSSIGELQTICGFRELAEQAALL